LVRAGSPPGFGPRGAAFSIDAFIAPAPIARAPRGTIQDASPWRQTGRKTLRLSVTLGLRRLGACSDCAAPGRARDFRPLFTPPGVASGRDGASGAREGVKRGEIRTHSE